MVKKRTIGKVQLGIGTILVLIVLFGGFIIYENWKDMVENFNSPGYIADDANPVLVSISFHTQGIILVEWMGLSIISFILSLLLITQGLANMSEDR